jgi:hypothetical protein
METRRIMQRTFRSLIVFVLASVATSLSYAATFYVATNGSDSYTCTQAQNITSPRQTLQAAINCMASGDTLTIRGGTYAHPSSNPPGGSSFTSATRIQRYGTEAVTVRGWAPIWTPTDHYIVLDGIKIDVTGLGYREAVWVDGDAHHIRMINCEVTGSIGTAGIGLYGSGGHHEILNCRVHHNGVDSQYDHGIYIHSPGNIIQGNEIDHNAAAGLHFYNGGVDMGVGNEVTKNRIHDNSTGIVAWNFSSALIANNIIYNHPNGQGISVNRAPGLMIYNNTITGSGGNGIDLSSYNSSVEIRNNIIYNNAVNINNLASDTILDHNLCNSGCAVNADPRFVSSNDFHLQSASPAIDRGLTISRVLTDLDGVARPQGAAYDIGAYEHSGSAPTSTPTPTPAPTPTTTPSSTPSPNGTRLPPATSITDNTGAVWTIAADLTILRNGVDTSGGGSQVLWYNGVIYAFGTDNQWYRWDGANWIYYGPNDPMGTTTPSPSPTPVPAGDTTPPTVTITSPSNGSTVARGQVITITATASDNVAVTRVEFYVDGSLKCTDTSSAYACSWKATGKRGTNHSIEARAFDAAGNVNRNTIVIRTQ